MAELRLVSRQEVERLVTLGDLIPIIRRMFADLAAGEGAVFPVVRELLPEHGGIFGIKSGYSKSLAAVGYKAGGFWEENASRGLPNHQSIIVLHDARTGVPVCAMDGNLVTVLRTGAAGAVALEYLARRDSRLLGLIGTGTQGAIQLRAALEVLPGIERVRCWDPDAGSAARLAAEAAGWDLGGRKVRFEPVAGESLAVTGGGEAADVVITATPSWKGHVRDEWIRPGMHVSAIGADTAGKQELEPAIPARSKVVADLWEQCRRIGECQHAFDQGLLRQPYAELPEIAAGRKPGRERADEITLFDATGIALQDIVTAHHVYRQAVDRGIGAVVVL